MLIKKSNFAVLFVLVLYVGVFAGNAQNKRSNILYPEPARLRLKGDYKTVKEEENSVLLREKFYPIGWSRDGKFAFYVEPVDEACGCYFAQLVIQDLRTDKILWEKSYDGKEEKEENLQTYWKQNRKEFSRRLAQYKIVAEKKFTLLDAPFSFQNDSFSLDLTQNLEFEDIFSVGNVNLRLISKANGAKTIYEEKYVSKDYSSLQSAEISGSLQSPFEPRAAIIMVETHRGWEGPPNITRIRIIGASLKNQIK